MLKQKEKGISLSLFYLKYFLYLFIVIAAICVMALVSFNGLAASNMLYPADYAQKQANDAQNRIKNATTVSEDLIPDLCQYIVFDFDGNVISGNIEGNEAKAALNAVMSEAVDNSIYTVIERDTEYCVLQYKIVPQYKSETLRKYLCPPQTLIIVSTLVLIFLSVVVTAVRFGHALKKKMNSLILVTEKIQNQDLDFSVEQSNIREINAILAAMDKMRKALKYSLENQWKAEQIRKEQISALAHDLKTPLTVVRGNAEILYDTNPTEEQIECINYIDDSSLQMQDYVKMLIEITKSTNLYSLKLQDVPVPEFVQSVQKQAKGLCSAKSIHLKWKLRSVADRFFADANLLNRALSNVLSNAVEYSTPDGTVTVEIYAENNYLVFSISDSGKGFSNEALKYAATQFYMDDSSRNSKSHFGIGLYVTDTIVKQHGGQLVLEDPKNISGAKVSIKIPL